MDDAKNATGYDVKVLPAAPGSVTTLDGSSVTTLTAGGQPIPPGSMMGGAGAGVVPVMMPQPSVIVVTVESKKPEKSKEAKSEVFKRP